MLKALVNEARLHLDIITTGPLLVKTGYATVIGADMAPVQTFRNGQQEVYLPGSSLKGVFRSHLEKIICSIKSGVACYPFWGNEAQDSDLLEQRQRDYRDSCSGRFVQRTRDEDERKRLEERTDLVYQDCCPVCRLFGSTGFIGRVAIGDAYLTSKSIKEQRDGVGIDRLTGGASHGAKFELEVVSPGVTFETDIHLRNFEIWQLGMLFVALQDMQDELIRIGSGRSRGLGKVTAQISDQGRNGRPGGFVTSSIRDMREHEEPDEVWGLGRWLRDQSASYGTWEDDRLRLSVPVEASPRGIRMLRAFEGEALASLQSGAIEAFIKRMQNWPEPKIPMFLNSR